MFDPLETDDYEDTGCLLCGAVMGKCPHSRKEKDIIEYCPICEIGCQHNVTVCECIYHTDECIGSCSCGHKWKVLGGERMVQ